MNELKLIDISGAQDVNMIRGNATLKVSLFQKLRFLFTNKMKSTEFKMDYVEVGSMKIKKHKIWKVMNNG